jgi:hypothetical protein
MIFERVYLGGLTPAAQINGVSGAKVFNGDWG